MDILPSSEILRLKSKSARDPELSGCSMVNSMCGSVLLNMLKIEFASSREGVRSRISSTYRVKKV